MTSPSEPAPAAKEAHLADVLDSSILEALAQMICGDEEQYPIRRRGADLDRFFDAVDIRVTYDGSWRTEWTLQILEQLDPAQLEKVVLRLVDPKTYRGDLTQVALYRDSMNSVLRSEGFTVDYRRNSPVLLETSLDDVKMALDREKAADNDSEFLSRPFSDDIDIATLGLDSALSSILQSRVEEVKSGPIGDMPLATIFLLGSTMEGMLFALASQRPKLFMSSSSAPKSKGRSTKIRTWTLSQLIDVAHNVGALDHDVKTFSHRLRDFRNFVHPNEQLKHRFEPTQDTVDICWHVFKAAHAELRTFAASHPVETQ